MAATIGQKLVSFFAFYVIARLVGPEVTGKYFYAVSITSVFVIFADLGMTPVVIRELAANEERGKQFLARALKIKAFLLPIAVMGAMAYALIVKTEPDVFKAVVIACGVLLADTTSLLFYGALRGKRDLRFEAIGMLVGQICTALASMLALRLDFGLMGLVVALLLGSAWNVGWSLWCLLRRGLMPFWSEAVPWQTIAKAALPFGLAGLFVKVYSYTDSLLLRQFQGNEGVGQYAVAYKITYALQFLPLVFVAALYPAMSADFAAGRKEALRANFKEALRLMLVVSIPLSALLSALAHPLISTFYGRLFAGAIAPMVVLPWVLIPIFLDFPVGSLLNATHRSSLKTISMGITMVVNVVLNILLVPLYGPVGAAYAGLVSFWGLFIIGFWFVRQDLPEPRWLGSSALRSIVAVAVIWSGTRVMEGILPFFAQALFGAALSVTVLFFLRLFTVEDLMSLVNLLRRRPAPSPEMIEEAIQ